MATFIENPLHARPADLQQALQLLYKDRYRIIAGGTDFYPSLADKKPVSPVLDITAIGNLRSLEVDEHRVEIGALCA